MKHTQIGIGTGMLFENRRSDAGLPAPMRRTVFAAMLTVLLLIVGPEVALGPAKAAAVTEGGAAMIDTIVPTVVSISTRKAEPPRPKVADLAMTDKATAAIGAETEPVIGNYVGSGFVIDPSGVIVTNYHVVEQAFEIVVTFSDGTALPGTVMGASKLIDLAVLKVVADHPLPFARWGDSDRLKIGDTVFAAGNPFGVGLSVSAGIVSALNRDIQNSPFDDLIQTDASINHGNSGCPLFNKAGEVVGVDSVIISPTTGSSGIGFAIPSDSAEFVVDHLVRNGRVRPGWIGVKVQQIKSDLATALGLPRARGSVVAWVQPNGPADKAGLAVGDVIERFSNSSFDDERALLRTIASARLRSWVRCCWQVIRMSPSSVSRRPASFSSRARTGGGNSARSSDSRNCTAVSTLLTFCPPGPDARINVSSNARSLIATVLVI